MNDLFSDKSKVFCKIKDIILKPNSNIQSISTELESAKDLKDLKSVVDFLIREQVLFNLKSKDIEKVKNYLKLSAELSRKDLSNQALPFVLFSDVLNSLTIQTCESFFSFMEECILKLKDTSVFLSSRALLLRICNDLLRRLSKSQNTVFCGKIQIFLSRLFPLDEKSGLNLMGHFNTENLTPFNESDTGVELDDDSSIDLTDETIPDENDLTSAIKVNKGFYKKFWILQDFFRNSVQCYDESKFATFSASVDEVLAFFSKFRVNLDSCKNEALKADWSSFSNADMTFTKYLTSEKLFDLQLMDPNFRRCVLVQLAVTFQYLVSPIKFKTQDQVLKEDQLKWIEKQQAELEKLFQALSSDREPFADIVHLVLSRESHKSNWKNEGCPSFVKKRTALTLNALEKDCDKRKVRIKVDKSGRQVVSFDRNEELTRLWNICPDNLLACRDTKRNYNPDLTEYFTNARMELDPEEKVEEKYQSINDEKWCWQSLRLLSRKSQHFYTNWTNPGQSIKSYLTTIIKHNLQPRSNEDEVGNDVGEVQDQDSTTTTTRGEVDEDDSCSPKPETTANDIESMSIILLHIDEIAQLIGDGGKRVGEALQFNANDLANLSDDYKTFNKAMLNLWLVGKSNMTPSIANMIAAFDEVGMNDIVTKIRSWME